MRHLLSWLSIIWLLLLKIKWTHSTLSSKLIKSKKLLFLYQHANKFGFSTNHLGNLSLDFPFTNCKDIKSKRREWQFILLFVKKGMVYFYAQISLQEGLIFHMSIGLFKSTFPINQILMYIELAELLDINHKVVLYCLLVSMKRILLKRFIRKELTFIKLVRILKDIWKFNLPYSRYAVSIKMWNT